MAWLIHEYQEFHDFHKFKGWRHDSAILYYNSKYAPPRDWGTKQREAEKAAPKQASVKSRVAPVVKGHRHVMDKERRIKKRQAERPVSPDDLGPLEDADQIGASGDRQGARFICVRDRPVTNEVIAVTGGPVALPRDEVRPKVGISKKQITLSSRLSTKRVKDIDRTRTFAFRNGEDEHTTFEIAKGRLNESCQVFAYYSLEEKRTIGYIAIPPYEKEALMKAKSKASIVRLREVIGDYNEDYRNCPIENGRHTLSYTQATQYMQEEETFLTSNMPIGLNKFEVPKKLLEVRFHTAEQIMPSKATEWGRIFSNFLESNVIGRIARMHAKQDDRTRVVNEILETWNATDTFDEKREMFDTFMLLATTEQADELTDVMQRHFQDICECVHTVRAERFEEDTRFYVEYGIASKEQVDDIAHEFVKIRGFVEFIFNDPTWLVSMIKSGERLEHQFKHFWQYYLEEVQQRYELVKRTMVATTDWENSEQCGKDSIYQVKEKTDELWETGKRLEPLEMTRVNVESMSAFLTKEVLKLWYWKNHTRFPLHYNLPLAIKNFLKNSKKSLDDTITDPVDIDWNVVRVDFKFNTDNVEFNNKFSSFSDKPSEPQVLKDLREFVVDHITEASKMIYKSRKEPDVNMFKHIYLIDDPAEIAFNGMYPEGNSDDDEPPIDHNEVAKETQKIADEAAKKAQVLSVEAAAANKKLEDARREAAETARKDQEKADQEKTEREAKARMATIKGFGTRFLAIKAQALATKKKATEKADLDGIVGSSLPDDTQGFVEDTQDRVVADPSYKFSDHIDKQAFDKPSKRGPPTDGEEVVVAKRARQEPVRFDPATGATSLKK